MKRHLFASVIIGGTLALSAGEAKAATITIDSFDDGFQHISAASSTTFNSTIYSANPIVRGKRDIRLTILENPSPSSLNAEVAVLPLLTEPGILTISNDTGVKSETLITWHGEDENGLSLDVTGGGINKFFRFNVLSADLEAILTLSVMDNNGTASLTRTLSPSFNPTSVVFKFNEFDNVAAIDLTQVDSISLAIRGEENFDFTAESIVATVPEPLTLLGSAIALGLGTVLKKEYDKKQTKSQPKR
jgi:hypothetical protein